MIASVHGTVQAVRLDAAVVEVGGVGLLVHATPATLAGLRVGSSAQLATSLVVREDALTLFGFADADEREIFETVQTVSGVGPRLALAMLAVHTPDGLRRAVLDEDFKALQRVPGIGLKGAQRIVLELKDRIGVPATRHARPRRPCSAGTGATRWSRRSSGSAGTLARRVTPSRPSWRAPRDPWLPTRSPGCCARLCGPWAAGMADDREELVTERFAAESLVQSGADDLERAAEAALRPRRLEEFVGQRVVRDQLSLVLDAARGRGKAPDHVLLSGPTGTGQDDAGDDHRGRDGRPSAGHQRPRHPACGRSRGRPVVARGGRGPLPRRDPPPRAPRRGAPLHGDGGLPGGRDRGEGGGRQRDPADPAAVHRRRGHHPGRTAPGTAAGQVRLHRAPRLLLGRRARAGAGPVGRTARRAAATTPRPRSSRRGPGARRGSRTACSDACGTGRRCAATAR